MPASSMMESPVSGAFIGNEISTFGGSTACVLGLDSYGGGGGASTTVLVRVSKSIAESPSLVSSSPLSHSIFCLKLFTTHRRSSF